MHDDHFHKPGFYALVFAALRAMQSSPSHLVLFGGASLAFTALANNTVNDNGIFPLARPLTDLDLLVNDRPAFASWLETDFIQLLEKDYPDIGWTTSPSSIRENDHAVLSTIDGIEVEVQLLKSENRWEVRAPQRRFLMPPEGDTATQPVYFSVPTEEALAATKICAALYRGEPKDWFDLSGLAELGAINNQTTKIVEIALGYLPTTAMLKQKLPNDWGSNPHLAHVIREDISQAWEKISVAWELALNSSELREGPRARVALIKHCGDPIAVMLPPALHKKFAATVRPNSTHSRS